jgi:protein SCO1/2
MRSHQYRSTLIYGFILSVASCGPDAFEKQIEISRQSGIDKISDVGDGLPYFLSKKMDPTWDKKNIDQLARITKLNLTDHRGRLIDEKFFTKEPTFVAFFYSSCAGICPMVLSVMKDLENKFGNSLHAKYLMISVDPDKDSPEALGRYAIKSFKGQVPKNWFFASGQQVEINRLTDEVFSIEAFKKKDKGDRIVHSERIFLVDSEGFVRTVLNSTSSRMDLRTQKDILALTPTAMKSL